jgi:hypothetical protein
VPAWPVARPGAPSGPMRGKAHPWAVLAALVAALGSGTRAAAPAWPVGRPGKSGGPVEGKARPWKPAAGLPVGPPRRYANLPHPR